MDQTIVSFPRWLRLPLATLTCFSRLDLTALPSQLELPAVYPRFRNRVDRRNIHVIYTLVRFIPKRTLYLLEVLYDALLSFYSQIPVVVAHALLEQHFEVTVDIS